MKRAWRPGAAVCLVAIAALSGASASLGEPAQTACFGLPATKVGSEGPDQLVGTPGNDVIVGLGGYDLIVGLEGNDALCGGPGDDSYVPGPGDDQVDGGGGGQGVGFIELVAFESPGPVQADLRAGVATGEGSDTLVNITGLIGTPFVDVFVGNVGVNQFYPGNGDDVVDGGGGDDLVGFDSAVAANLSTGSATGEGTDTLVSIEMLSGSKLDDVLIGDGGGNYLSGGSGRDIVRGGAGNDRLYGDDGRDDVLGEAGDDRTSGNDGADLVVGGTGNDTLSGGIGDDTIVGGKGADIVSFLRGSSGIQANLLIGRVTGEGLDKVSGAENVEGTQFRDRILGDVQTNFIFGNAGADAISAGPGADFLDAGVGGGSLSDGSGRDYCLQGTGAGRCEISGTPGKAPPIKDTPPASLTLPADDAGSLRTGIVMPLPKGQRNAWRSLRAARGHALRVFTNGTLAQPVRPSMWPLVSPLWTLFTAATPPGTGSFRYTGQPTCYAARRPYRTTVAPPDELQPAMLDGRREQVFWRGVLFQRDRKSGKFVRKENTPWVTAVVQGPNIPTGFPRWTNTAGAGFVSSFDFNVPAGTYAWKHKIRWERTKAEHDDFIEPHIVQTPRVQPDKACTFGSGG